MCGLRKSDWLKPPSGLPNSSPSVRARTMAAASPIVPRELWRVIVHTIGSPTQPYG